MTGKDVVLGLFSLLAVAVLTSIGAMMLAAADDYGHWLIAHVPTIVIR